MDHPALKMLAGALGKPLEGIVGYTFFARYRTTIDYQAHEMKFAPVDFEVRDLVKDLQAKLMGPKVARQRVVAPRALWGFTVGEPAGGVSSLGVPVTAVATGSAADAAGLKAGDIVTTLDGRWTASISDVYAAARAVTPGQATSVKILRDDREMTLTVTPRDGI
jgi:S1-C subfamily serine protease